MDEPFNYVPGLVRERPDSRGEIPAHATWNKQIHDSAAETEQKLRKEFAQTLHSLRSEIVDYVRKKSLAVIEVAAKRASSAEPALNATLLAFVRTAINDALREDAAAAAKDNAAFVRLLIGEEMAPLAERVGVLEDVAVSDGGIWSASKQFRKNALTTFGGNIWISRRANSNEQPGHGDAWRLIEKTKGRR